MVSETIQDTTLGAIQDFSMDLEQESCKIFASSKSWHGFGTDFLPTCQILKCLGKILQDRDSLRPLALRQYIEPPRLYRFRSHGLIYTWTNYRDFTESGTSLSI